MDVRKVGPLFDDWAAKGRASGMEAGHGQTAGPALGALGLGPGDRLLDIGTGNGWACRHAIAAGADAVGVDLSLGMLRLAARAVPVMRADAQRLPLADGACTVAWSMEALYYAPDPDAVLAEVARVLRPGGRFHVLIDHYAENEASHDWPEQTGLDMVLRSEQEWVEAFRRAGFTDVRAGRLRADEGEAWKQEEGTLHLTGAAQAGDVRATS